jgi:L-lactate dehydrogenase complex protein LldF
MKIEVERFRAKAASGIRNAAQREVLNRLRVIFTAVRDYAFSTLKDPDAALARSRDIRREAVKNLPAYLEQFEQNVIKNGGTVLWAADYDQARDLVVELARERSVTTVTKGKSMLSEEIGLNEALIRSGIDVYETDLGEFIVQQAHRTPFHIVGPALNMSVDEIADLFVRVMGSAKTLDLNELAMQARAFLRDKFKRAGMGITGASMAVAETGTIVLVENEGNIRFSTSAPATHVVVMGIDKVVPTMNDALSVLKVLTRSCTGQAVSSYVSFIDRPRQAGDIDGPGELIVVIVDAGRSRIYEDPEVREVLQCIKCGACLNTCPVWATVGGYAYGWVYSGPIGALLNPLFLGLDRAQDLYFACTLCGKCREVCPAGIDHPELFLKLREKRSAGEARFGAKRPPISERIAHSVWAWAVLDERRFRLAARLMRWALLPFRRRGAIPWLPTRAGAFTRDRDLPFPARTPFRDRWETIKKDMGKDNA